jgi:hypothetical protein
VAVPEQRLTTSMIVLWTSFDWAPDGKKVVYSGQNTAQSRIPFHVWISSSWTLPTHRGGNRLVAQEGRDAEPSYSSGWAVGLRSDRRRDDQYYESKHGNRTLAKPVVQKAVLFDYVRPDLTLAHSVDQFRAGWRRIFRANGCGGNKPEFGTAEGRTQESDHLIPSGFVLTEQLFPSVIQVHCRRMLQLVSTQSTWLT